MAHSLPSGLVSRLAVLVLVIMLWLGPAGATLAAPVNWQELPETAEGRQWWDGGSLRLNRQGMVTVLSRYQTAAVEGRRSVSHLVVMEIDCGQARFRDTSVDGLPRLGATWQEAGQEDLTHAVVSAACAAMAARQSIPEP